MSPKAKSRVSGPKIYSSINPRHISPFKVSRKEGFVVFERADVADVQVAGKIVKIYPLGPIRPMEVK